MTEFSYYFKRPEAFPLPELLEGVSEPWQLLERVTAFLKGQTNNGKENHIGEGTVIPDGAHIIGPVWIGEHVEILPGALIRPYCIIGDGCSVGHGSEVKHSVMFAGSKVASLAFVGDSVLGKSSRIGSGVITGNRKFNQSAVTCKFPGRGVFGQPIKVDLHSDYFGLVLGDYSRLGANAVSQPGTHVGGYTWVYPQTLIRGFIPERKRVFERKELEFQDNEAVELR